MTVETLQTDTPELFRSAVKRAAELLRAGGVVALPTETVYGLAANALDPKAVAAIYNIKGRPAHNPIIVHVTDVRMAMRCVEAWPAPAAKLAATFWPGPLTLVLPRSKAIPDIVTAGGPTVGVRCPSHPLIRAVIRECGFPLAAPSANPSNRVSPTTAAHVRNQLGKTIACIVDGGSSHVGIESTVLDLTVQPPRILRPGVIGEAALAAVIGPVQSGAQSGGALKSPGLLARHYAPRAKLAVLTWRDDADLKSQISNLKSQMSTCHVIAHTRVPSPEGFGRVSLVPPDPEAFARALYAELHRCDDEGAGCIVVEAPPESHEWTAIRDRLRRAGAK